MRVHESQIRDALITRLHLLEKGLRWVATEYPLPNHAGTSGRVDILARDATGCFVVIELKRTDVAAQRALHEIAKYTELFQREKGLGPADVRAALVSVTWQELTVPFSQTASRMAGRLCGYRLILGDDGVTPVAATRVEPLAASPEPSFARQQLFIQSRNGDLDGAWRWVESRFGTSGLAGLVGFEFTHPEYNPGVYLVLGDHDSNGATADDAMQKMGVTPPGYTLELASPLSLASLRSDPAWTPGAVRRSGIYVDPDLYPDRFLLHDASTGGLSDIKYTGIGRADYQVRWMRFRRRIDRALGGNEEWAATTTVWLDAFERETPSETLIAHVYNPCDLIAAFGFGWPARFSDYVPMLEFLTETAGHASRLRGVLVGNGSAMDVLTAFETVYQDVEGWQLARAHGLAWEFDTELLRLLGLRYATFEQTEGHIRLLEWQDGKLIPREADHNDGDVPEWTGVEPLPTWTRRQRHPIQALSALIRSETHILD